MLNFLSLLVRDEPCYWLPARILFIVRSSNFLKKITKASSIRTCSLLADIRLKYCGRKIFFSQSTLAIKFLNFLFPKKCQIQQQKNYINIKCIFHFGYFPADLFFQGFSWRRYSWEHIRFYMRAYKLFLHKLQLLKINKK